MSETLAEMQTKAGRPAWSVGAAALAMGMLAGWGVYHMHWPQTYTDVVVGAASWTGLAKSLDYAAMGVTVAVTALMMLLLQRLVGAFGANAGGAGKVLWLGLLPLAVAVGAGVMQTKVGVAEMPGFWMGVGFLAMSVIYVWGLLRWRAVVGAEVGADIFALAARGMFLAFLGMMAWVAFGYAMARGLKLSPGWGRALSFAGWIGMAGTAAWVAAIFRFSRSVREVWERMQRLLIVLQLPLPLLVVALVPPAIVREDGEVVRAYVSGWFYVGAAALALGVWWRLAKKWRAVDGERAGFELRISGLAMACVAGFLAAPLGQNGLEINQGNRAFHFGEQLLPWQQWRDFGNVPWVDFAPIHGLMSLMRGMIGDLFFGGGFTAYNVSSAAMGAFIVGVTFILLRRFVGVYLALLAAFCFGPGEDVMAFGRYLCLPGMMLLLALPELVSRPAKWLWVWFAVGVVGTLYNPPIGAALVLGSLPAAVWMFVRAWRADRRKTWVTAGGILCVGALGLLLPWIGPMMRGFVRFILENGGSNSVANGNTMGQNFVAAGDTLGGSNALLYFLVKNAWIALVVACAVFWWREMRLRREVRRADVLVLTTVGIGWTLAVLPWAMNRFEAAIERNGSLGAILAMVIVPAIWMRARRGDGAGAGWRIVWLVIGAMLMLVPLEAGLDERISGRIAKVARGEAFVAPTDMPPPASPLHEVMGHGVTDPLTVRLAERWREPLSELLSPTETYFDLTNKQAMFYMLAMPTGQLYGGAYVAANEATQNRMLGQIYADPPPIAVIGPAENFDGSASLRTYRLYRYFVLNDVVSRRDDLVVMGSPQRLAEIAATGGRRGDETQSALLDAVFHPIAVHDVPAAWGASWNSMAGRFREAAPAMGAVGGNLLEKVLSVDVAGLKLRGADADFVKIRFRVERAGKEVAEEPLLRLRFTGEGQEHVPPMWMYAPAGGGEIVVPMGSMPRWLLCEHVKTIELGIERGAGSTGIFVEGVSFWKLADILDPATVKPAQGKLPRENKPRIWAQWSPERAGELAAGHVEAYASLSRLAALNADGLAHSSPVMAQFAGDTPARLLVVENSALRLPGAALAAAKKLHVEFGMAPSGAEFVLHDVTFRISSDVQGKTAMLFEKKLNPLAMAKEMETQTAEFDVPEGAGELIFETQSPYGARFGLDAYWQKISPAK